MLELPEVVYEAVRRIVAAADPDRIILFGSAARGEMGPDSDLDFLVIKDVPHRRNAATKIHGNLGPLGVPVDVIVVTPDDVEKYKDCPYTIIEPALTEGLQLYAKQ